MVRIEDEGRRLQFRCASCHAAVERVEWWRSSMLRAYEVQLSCHGQTERHLITDEAAEDAHTTRVVFSRETERYLVGPRATTPVPDEIGVKKDVVVKETVIGRQSRYVRIRRP